MTTASHVAGDSGASTERLRGKISTGETNVMVQPTFQAGDVRYYDITTTSVRLTWPKPADKKFPVYAYRISTREVGCGFEVAHSEAPSSSAGCVIVGLKPGRRYQFHVAPISLERMLVPGASIVSDTLTLPEAEYEKAWFFEGGEEDGPWNPFEGAGPDAIEEPGGGMWNAISALDTVRCSRSSARCFMGLSSLRITVPPEVAGGAFVDTPVRKGGYYLLRARVLHEGPPATAGGETRIVVWDMGDEKHASGPVKESGEWEALDIGIIPRRSNRLRIAVQRSGGCRREIFVDAVELIYAGPTPTELAMSSVKEVLGKPRADVPSKVKIRIESAQRLGAADPTGTSDPHVRVFVEDDEVYRTKVAPMTLSPAWNETFVICPGASGDRSRSDYAPWGVRFEIWDHNTIKSGCCLGEVCLTPAGVVNSPPHRVEHRVAYVKNRRKSATRDSIFSRHNGDPRPCTLAIALQVSWPQDDAETVQGRLVEAIQDEKKDLSLRQKALEPRFLEKAAREKESLLRARAPEAAVWALAEDDLVGDACRLLLGFLKLERAVGATTEAGFDLGRRLQKHVLALSPAVPIVRCFRAGVGQPEFLLELLVQVYAGQQMALHLDLVAVRGLFRFVVLHTETHPAAQAIMREISAGRRELPVAIIDLFRRYRTRIPLLPGLWRPELLSQIAREQELVAVAAPRNFEEGDEEEDDVDIPKQPRTLVGKVVANGAVSSCVLPPLAMVVIGAHRAGSRGSCEQPVATLVLLDGLVLLVAALAILDFQVGSRRLGMITDTWLFPIGYVTIITHILLVALLITAIAAVDYVGHRGQRRAKNDAEEDVVNGKGACSPETYAWGILFLILDVACIVAALAIIGKRRWRRITWYSLSLVIPEVASRHEKKHVAAGVGVSASGNANEPDRQEEGLAMAEVGNGSI